MGSRHDLRRLALALISLGLVLYFFLGDLKKKSSPGPLSAAHAQVAGLSDSDRCEDCHGERASAMADACIGCHAAIGTELEAKSGLHGRLAEESLRACSSCHSEHHGEELVLVTPRSFELAGFARREDYAHEGVAFRLEGAHASLGCVECHSQADAAFLKQGSQRFLGASQACQSCHEDPHHGRMARGCEACHAQAGEFKTLTAFQHAASFPLEGAHAIADCERCHEPDGAFSVEAVASRAPPASRTCSGCHESPHGQRFLDGLAQAGVVGCEACHASVEGGFHAPTARLEADLHAATGFSLAPPHEKAGCADCHAGTPGVVAASFAERYPGRAANDCALCHGDPHQGQFVAGAFAGASCLDCHDTQRFHPSSFDIGEHARTAFPLEQSHAAVPCQACHERVGETQSVRFTGTPSACDGCHADAHHGGFDTLWASTEREESSSCAHCHQPTQFARYEVAAFDHGQWTSFALRGAHARAACESCHEPSAAPDAEGRRFGRVASELVATAASCSGCHEDVHEGEFDGRPTLPGEPAGCARCHDEESWRGAREDFDHGQWTRFALDGAHARADCTVCHPAPPAPTPGTRALGRVEWRYGRDPVRCESCHNDVHRSAFPKPSAADAQAARGSCARCHATESWEMPQEAPFDHGRWTGFRLEGAHGLLDCAKCHATLPEGDRSGRSFAFAVGTSCAACHADPHYGQFDDRGPADCGRCHDGLGSFELARFDHDRDSRYPLDKNHVKLDCSSCHRPSRLSSGAMTVRYKPLGTTCVECHGTTQVREGGRKDTDVRK